MLLTGAGGAGAAGVGAAACTTHTHTHTHTHTKQKQMYHEHKHKLLQASDEQAAAKPTRVHRHLVRHIQQIDAKRAAAGACAWNAVTQTEQFSVHSA